MPTIEVSEIIKQDKKRIYNLLKNMERFPEFMRDVKKVTLLQRLPNKCITAWEVEIDGVPLRWEEIDIFDDDQYRIDFEMIKGDYQGHRGCWQLKDLGLYTRVSLKTEFNWGIPVLEKYVNQTLMKKAKVGFLGMLRAIKKKLEG